MVRNSADMRKRVVMGKEGVDVREEWWWWRKGRNRSWRREWEEGKHYAILPNNCELIY